MKISRDKRAHLMATLTVLAELAESRASLQAKEVLIRELRSVNVAMLPRDRDLPIRLYPCEPDDGTRHRMRIQAWRKVKVSP